MERAPPRYRRRQRRVRERVEQAINVVAGERRAVVVRDEQRRRPARGARDHVRAFELRQRQRCVIHVTVQHRQVDRLVAEVLGGLVGLGRRRTHDRALVLHEHVCRRQLGDVVVDAHAAPVVEVPAEIVTRHLVRLLLLVERDDVRLAEAGLPPGAQRRLERDAER